MAATTSGYSGGVGCYFPVIFHDGEQESHIGKIYISAYTDFKSVQAYMSSKIGISPNQFITFLKQQKQPSRKIPITPKTKFSDVLQDTKHYFFVSLKRSKDDKNKIFKENKSFLSPNVMLPKKREDGVDWFYDVRLKSLNSGRDRFLDSLGNTNVDVNGRQQQRRGVFKDVVCEECLKGTTEFHLCVRDAVVAKPFRSAFGPVARPGKKIE